MFDFNCGIETDEEFNNPVIKKESVETILGVFKNAISFDIAKNHTGVCIWHDGKLDVLGFEIGVDYDKNDNMSEAKMRLWLKNKCAEIMGDVHYDACQVEGVYGGENFDTTRKLIALNGVVAELILENRVKVDNYYNLIQKEWAKDFRKVIKIGKALSSKYETQEILKYLDFDFAVRNADLSESKKKSIFYEDICDAVGMLCGVALRINSNINNNSARSIRLSNVKMYFIDDTVEIYELRRKDAVLDNNELTAVDIETSDIDNEILDILSKDSEKVYCACIDNNKLGRFGVAHKFPFYDQGYGYLIFYNKELKRGC